ncbi:MAG: hypothetical protein OQL06_08795 [Gammaproteobacteria bacterium]|nr:hypothetical protein [Gammaproteobacteria bacterium]
MTHIEKDIRYSPTGNTGSNDRAREINDWSIEHARHEATNHLEVIRF